MKSKGINKAVIVVGVVLMIGAIAGFFVLGKIINPDPVYIMGANVDIAAGTDLRSLSQSSIVNIPMSGNASMLSSFVTQKDMAKMIEAGGKFVNNVSRFEPIKYTDILSSANPLSSKVVALGQDDPNLVVMTIKTKEYAPVGIRPGDHVDLISAVASYGTRELYEAQLAQLMVEAKARALEGMKPEEIPGYIAPDKEPDKYVYSEGFDNPSGQAFIAQNAMTQEMQQMVEDLKNETRRLDTRLEKWEEFLELYGTLDPMALSEQLEHGFYIAPLAKTLVQGAKIISVGRADSGADSQDAEAAVKSLDILVPRDAAEWIAMADESGNLRIALLSPNAKPSGSGPTLGASLQDLLEAFANDRGEGDNQKSPVIPSSR